MRKTILLVTLIFCLKLTYSQPGQLDPLFGSNGIVKSVFGPKNDEKTTGRQILLKTDGSMFIITETKEQTLIAKRLSNGSPDSSYGVNGFSVSVPIFSGRAAFQSDGKIVVAGTSYNGNQYSSDYTDFSIARYNTNGSLDKTFSGDGQLTTDFGNNEGVSSVAIQADGKILIAGNSNSAGDDIHFDLIRYNKDGSLDKVFHADQFIQNRFGFNESNANSLAIQKDGKIVISGYVATFTGEGTSSFLLMRFNTDGSLDSAFGDNGIVTDNDANLGYSIIIQSDEKIVVAGDSLLRRHNKNGTPDNTFSGDGKQTSPFPIASAAMQTDGKIVVGGTSSDNFAIARYYSNGSLDNTFSGDGRQITDLGASDKVNSIAIQTDGKLVVAGYSSNASITNFAVARYAINGALDNTLTGDGTLTDHLRQGNTIYKSVAVQSDGKIVSGGNRILVRYTSTGVIDKTFSGDGIQTTDFSVNSLAIQSDGKIVAAGDRVLARYNTDGSLDAAFSGDGKQSVNFVINSIVIQSNGKIVAGGSALTRYKTDGSIDVSFAGDGEIFTPFNCMDLAIQGDGKVIAVGSLNGNFAVARYTTGGYPDNSFDGDGLQTTDFNPDDEDYDPGYTEEFHAQSVAIQSDGKIIAAGYTLYPYRTIRSRFALARYNTNGSLDTGFSQDGMQTTGFGGKDRASSAAIQSDGKILVAGYAWIGSNKDFALARYNADGNPDNTFAKGGIQITPVSGTNDEIESIAIANNKLYTVGYAQYPNNTGVVARYLLEANKAPAVKITSPANNAVYNAPATINISAAATDSDGKISSVKFYNGTTLLKTENYAPYTYTWSNVPAGTYSLTAKATDNFGLTTTSAVVSVTVKPSNAMVSGRPSAVTNKTDQNSALSLRLSPNPARNTLNVYTNGLRQNKQATISILSASGAAVKTINTNASNKVIQLDVSSLVRGVYVLKILSGDKVMYQQFVKL